MVVDMSRRVQVSRGTQHFFTLFRIFFWAVSLVNEISRSLVRITAPWCMVRMLSVRGGRAAVTFIHA